MRPDRTPPFFAALLCAAILSLADTASADRLDCPCKVVKVTDGDTVHVLDRGRERHKIRLGGIDAPESKQVFGKKSSKNLSRLVAGRNVEVEYDKRDRYGRIIGKILRDGQDMNLQQIKDGFAWHYKRYQNEQSSIDRVLYSAAEDEARARKIGLWSVPAVPPWEYRRASKK
jgi:endonuclease YncB( thermonuclease family)